MSGRGLWCQVEGYGVRERAMVSGRGLWCQGVRERAMVSGREKVKAVHLTQLP